MNWILNILGANSAVPTRSRFPSSQVLEVGGTSILIDCGEGTQMRMLEQNIKKSRISIVLISHLHGDHIYGLPGLLTSYNLFGRSRPLCIIGPVGIREFVGNTIGITGHELSYPVEFIELDSENKDLVFEGEDMDIYSFPLKHRIPTYGYQVKEKLTRVYLDKEKVLEYRLSDKDVQLIIEGESIEIDGEKKNLSFFERTRVPISYSYVSDTKWFPECSDFIHETTVLYHESTFLEADGDLASDRYHSTAKEAAICGAEGKAKNLILGHFSSRYKDLDFFKSEAEQVFSRVYLAKSGKSFLIFDDESVSEV